MMPRTRRHTAWSSLTALLGTTFILAAAGPLCAQSIDNPRLAEFEPSPDHATMLADGQPMVSSYALEIYRTGAATPFHMVDIGKPAPRTDGKIGFDFWSQVASWPLPGGAYEARVAAIGPDGIGRSDRSNTFTFTISGGCAYTLSTESVSLPGSGGSVTVNVTSSAGCAWSSSSAVSWITLSAPGGSGSGAITVNVAHNPSASSRIGTITIAGRAVTVSQFGARRPVVGPPPSLVIGKGNTVSGTSLTPGSVVKLFVATGAGPVAYGPYKPTSTTATSLTFSIPRNVQPGNGFAALQVINTDTGYQESNLVGALLGGNAALGLPTITKINGTALAPANMSVGLAHISTVVGKGSTVTITGTGFLDPVVNVFTASGNLGPLTPLAGGSDTQIQVAIPATASAGPGNFQVINRPGYEVSATVSAVIGAVPTISRVSMTGGTVTVTGTGFSTISVINLFNKQGTAVVNLGGFGPGGPKVPLAVTGDTRFTFARPTGAMAGPAFVQVLNPPFIEFSSSGADPDGAFTMGSAPPPLLLTDAATAAGTSEALGRDGDASASAAAVSDEPVTWTRAVDATVEGQTLRARAAASPADTATRPWRAGARSTRALLEGEGHVEWTVTDDARDVAFGLDQDDADGTLTDIAFAWRLDAATRELLVYEGGVRQAAVGTYAAGDLLHIAVRNGVVEYRRNGTVVWISERAPRYPLVADASLGSPETRLSDVRLTGRLGAVVDWPAHTGVAVASMRASVARRVPNGRPLVIGGAPTVAPDASGTRVVSAELAGTAGIGLGAAACDYCIVRTGSAVEVRHEGVVRGRWHAELGARYRVELGPSGTVRYWNGDLLLDEAPLAAAEPLTVRGLLGRTGDAAILGAATNGHGLAP